MWRLLRLAPLLTVLAVLSCAWPSEDAAAFGQSPPWPQLRALAGAPVGHNRSVAAGSLHSGRRLAGCNALGLRLLPPPSYTSYKQCFSLLLEENSTHDWSIPGAKIDGQIDCWCANNLTATIDQYGCCNHRDMYPMCTIDCAPDCTSPLAQQCLESCPSMCFEASEYVVHESHCADCHWENCWPVLKCLTEHAKHRVQTQDLNRTCDEVGFVAGSELEGYRQCWRDIPKHSSHWNIMASIVHCICREDMVQHTKDEHCCESILYGWGVCDLECVAEAECNSQAGQTCINRCQGLCAAFDIAPSEECKTECLSSSSSCRKYTSCPPPNVIGHVCDDGRWPEASSGCCETSTGHYGCPKLCEAQHIWRLDGSHAIPWWSKWQPGPGIIFQCSCEDCPQSTQEGLLLMQKTLEETIWDNGQMLLVDIARREGLRHGPNRKMQELMVARNEEVLRGVQGEQGNMVDLDGTTAAINERYIELITEAARLHGDEEVEEEVPAVELNEEKSYGVFAAIASLCTVAIIAAIGCATWKILQSRKAGSGPVTGFEQNQQVVIGNPVPDGSAATATPGAPVTVSATTKGQSKAMQHVAKELQ